MRLRPCIDIHDGKVKQIVGGTLTDENREGSLRENYVSAQAASYYASLYREKGLPGGHIILLNSAQKEPEAYAADREQALAALRAYPGGMQVGGGVTPENAGQFLEAGASHVIVTSYVFRNGTIDRERLARLVQTVGRERLVLDVSCRRRADGTYAVVTDRWQKFTDVTLCPETLDELRLSCDEFLIHAADVEGKSAGIEEGVVRLLGDWLAGNDARATYAGGVHSFADLERIRDLSGGRLDVTVGSALTLFGGTLPLEELAAACG
ncbi:MAG: phosphoribosylformimino-5-aminoimidazole carboxamide ribotide isomerase [Eubacteriales bacterium]|nr:phosphoribosylformimino-5-aminoimidazole carboxamide ribotide isomerase [Eubacteriales bacterium]